MRKFALPALLAALVAIYGQVYTHDFINLDDNIYVSENPYVQQGLSFAGIKWAFTTFEAGHWHPLTWLSYMLDGTLFGAHAGAIALENLAWHMATVALIFLCLKMATGEFALSLAVTSLFALHPLRVESIVWISERKDVLAAFFWWATCCLYVHYTKNVSKRRYALIVVSFIIGLLAKPTIVTLPVILLLLDYWPLQRKESKLALIKEKLPLLVCSAALSCMTMLAQHSARAVQEVPFSDRLANAITGLGRYIGLLLWPQSLAIFYPLQRVPNGTAAAIFSALLLVTCLAWQKREKEPYLIVGWLWFLGCSLPIMGIVQVGGQSIADRWTYLPHIGLLVALCWSLRKFGQPAKFALYAALIILSCLSFQQIRWWQNTFTLFHHTIDVTGDNFFIQNNLGVAYDKKGDLEEAGKHYVEAVRLAPHYPDALNNMGTYSARTGRLPEAIDYFRQAVAIDPQHAKAQYHLGLALSGINTSEAEEHLKTAQQLAPRDADIYLTLGDLYERRGDLKSAMSYYGTLAELRPDWPEARVRLQRVQNALH